MSWPFAHIPDHFTGTCTSCSRTRDVVVVTLDRAESIERTGLAGAFELLCWSCLGRDGDPLHRTR